MQYTHTIYKLIFPNNKVYIGQTKQEFDFYMSQYKNTAYNENSKDYNRLIHRAIRKYEWENVIKEIICTCNINFIDNAERYFIKKYNSIDRKFGYNLESGGNKNKILSEETKKKIGEVHKGNKYCLGKTHSEETKKKMNEVKIGNNYNLGKKCSNETIEKIKQNHKGMLGKSHSEKTKKKMKKNHPKYWSGKSNIKLFKSINAYTKDGNFIKNFESVKQAGEELKINNTHISSVLNRKRKTTGGYIFKYLERN